MSLTCVCVGRGERQPLSDCLPHGIEVTDCSEPHMEAASVPHRPLWPPTGPQRLPSWDEVGSGGRWLMLKVG